MQLNNYKFGHFGIIQTTFKKTEVHSYMQAEGIFRINAENSQEEYVRDQLNRGVIPEGIDVHCLAGLIKVRRLPIVQFRLIFICHPLAKLKGSGSRVVNALFPAPPIN